MEVENRENEKLVSVTTSPAASPKSRTTSTVIEFTQPFYTKKSFKIFIIFIFIFVIALSMGLVIYLNMGTPVHGAVASSNYYATNIGVEVLKNGGNAVDAFIAMQAMLTLTEPGSSGIGGGLFLIYYNKAEDKVYVLDGREEAPYNISTEPPFYTFLGGGGAGTPGTIAAIKEMHTKFATKSIADLFQPTINQAREGWIVNDFFGEQISRNNESLFLYPSSRALYYDSQNQPLKSGSKIINNDLADTFQRLVDYGLDDFYTGEIAESIISAIQNDPYFPGVMTLEDLKNYKPVYRAPVWSDYKGYQMVSMNAPSSAIIISEAFNMLENIDYTKEGFDSLSRIVYFLNTMSLCFADRAAYTADADWEDVPIAGLLEKAYGLERSKLVNISMGISYAPPGTPKGAPQPDLTESNEGFHTTHFSIIDNFGNMLVCTSTIQAEMGGGYVVPGRGFFLNNELTDFSNTGINKIVGGTKLRRTALSPLNETLGGKRPRSSMSPTIIFKDGVPRYGLGSPNGPRIISAVAQVILNIIDFGMDIQTAVNMPRVHTNNSDTWTIEADLLEDYLDLLSPGYIPKVDVNSIGVVSVVENNNGKYSAAADSKRRVSSLAVSF